MATRPGRPELTTSKDLRNGTARSILVGVKIRVKLAGAPLGYTLALVEGTAEPYKTFGTELWSDDQAVPAALKELVFLRTSIVNECPT